MTALDKYNEHMAGEYEPDPVERLRFFLAQTLTGKDWLDVEQFIDGVIKQRDDLLAALEAIMESCDSGNAAVLDNLTANARIAIASVKGGAA